MEKNIPIKSGLLKIKFSKKSKNLSIEKIDSKTGNKFFLKINRTEAMLLIRTLFPFISPEINFPRPPRRKFRDSNILSTDSLNIPNKISVENKGYTIDWQMSSDSYPNLQCQVDVYIGLPQEKIDLFATEKIQNACGDFMEALGFELKVKDEPVYGSFFQKLRFLLKKRITQEQLDELLITGKLALENKVLNLPTAKASEKLAIAASKIIDSLSDVDEATIRLGAIIVVKVKIDGKITIKAETVSPILASTLDNMPNILTNPRAIYELLEVSKNKGDAFQSGENLRVAE